MSKEKISCQNCGGNLLKKVEPPEDYNGTKKLLDNIGQVRRGQDGKIKKAICLECRGWGQQFQSKEEEIKEDKKNRGYIRLEQLHS